MSVGVAVVASVVGAFTLYETVLPRLYAALRKWRRERARAKAKKCKPSPKDDAAVRPNGLYLGLCPSLQKESFVPLCALFVAKTVKCVQVIFEC